MRAPAPLAFIKGRHYQSHTMSPAPIDRLHSDPAHWKLGIFYVCPADRRLIVPKRIRGLGWTLNFGRPMAVPLLILVPLLFIGIIKLAIYLGASHTVILAIKGFLFFVTLAVGLCLSKSVEQTPPADSERHPEV